MVGQIATVKLVALAGYAALFFVLLRGRVPPGVKLHFSLYVLGLGLWQMTSFIVTLTSSAASAVMWYNLQLSAVTLQSFIFYPLTRAFLQRPRAPAVTVSAYLCCAAAVAVGVLQLGASRVVPGQAGYFVPIINPAAYIVTLSGWLFQLLGVFELVGALRRDAVRLQRIRIRYVLAGTIIVMVGMATNATALQAYPVDTVCALINALLVAYAVTRYRLIDTGNALRLALGVMLILALGTGGYILFSWLYSLLARSASPWNPEGLTAFLILMGLWLLLGWKTLRPVLDRLAGRRLRNYDQALDQFARTTRSMLNSDDLKELTVRVAAEAVGTERGCLLVGRESDAAFDVGAVYGPWPAGQVDSSRDAFADLLRVLQDRRSPLWEQELAVNPDLADVRNLCEPFFRQSGAVVAVPLLQSSRVIAVLCLGERSAGGLYDTEDLRFLSTLANFAASTLQVALHHGRTERQLSLNTFLFVLSQSLIRSPGSAGALVSALEVVQGYLRLDFCALSATGAEPLYAPEPVSSELQLLLHRALEVLPRWEPRPAANPVAPIDGTLVPWPPGAAGTRFVESLRYLPLKNGEEWIGVLAMKGPADQRDVDSSAVWGALSAILSQGLLTVRHVSELRTLKDYNEKILESLSASGEMLLVLNARGQVIRTNAAAVRALEIPEAELVGRTLRQFLEPESADSELEGLLRGSSRGPQSRELVLCSGSGRRVPVLVATASVPVAGDEVPEIVLLARDITEQQELQRQLLQAQKMETVGTLAGGIAHDFNNILTAAIGFSKLIADNAHDADAVRGFAKIVDSSMKRAADLTHRLLSFARAGVVDKKPLLLNDIVRETVQLLRKSFDLSIAIQTDCPPELPAILGDHGQVHQMLMNLCVNARDAMPDGGVLRLSTAVTASPGFGAGTSSALYAQRCVRLEVSDTGCGIPAADLARIFDPFFTTKAPGKGTGLGLSIVYGIVQRHGGRIEVSSPPGSGTTFRVLFPVAEEGQKVIPPAAVQSRATPGSETIMVVDDESDVRSLVRIALGQRGYTVIEAADGIDAVEQFQARTGPIDLVVIDLVMPRLGGRETYQRLKALDPGLKAMFATGYGIDDQTSQLLSDGVLGILRKPFDIPALESEIRTALDGARRGVAG